VYIADKGKLPLSVHAIDSFLADPSHQTKSVGRALYALFCGEGKKIGFTNVDCKRLKHNHGFWQCQNHLEPFDVFKTRSAAIIEHHYGNHEWCVSTDEDGWCQYKNNTELMEQAKKENRFCCQTVHKEQYKKVCDIWKKFSTDAMLKQLHHPCLSQKNESMNFVVMRHAHKDQKYLLSMELSNRVSLVVAIDLIGYRAMIDAVIRESGQIPNIIMHEFLK